MFFIITLYFYLFIYTYRSLYIKGMHSAHFILLYLHAINTFPGKCSKQGRAIAMGQQGQGPPPPMQMQHLRPL